MVRRTKPFPGQLLHSGREQDAEFRAICAGRVESISLVLSTTTETVRASTSCMVSYDPLLEENTFASKDAMRVAS